MATEIITPLENNSISSDSSSSSSEFYESSDDSIVDKNFVPSDDDETSDTSEVCIYFCFCGISCFTKKKSIAILNVAYHVIAIKNI